MENSVGREEPGMKTHGVEPKPNRSHPTPCRKNGWPDIRMLIKPDQVARRSLSQGSLRLFYRQFIVFPDPLCVLVNCFLPWII